MTHHFLSLGSNIQPEKNLPKCIQKLKEIFETTRTSSLYETDPIGPAGDVKFWNAVVSLETSLDLRDFTEKIQELENQLGRRRDPHNKFAPRCIDIDILPQPGYQQLGFILIPLAELVPETKDPESGKTFRQLAHALSNEEKSKCRKVS